MRTAVVLMTHRFDKPILDEFERMREALHEDDRAFLLSDVTAPTPAGLAPLTHAFSYAAVARRAARVIGDGILRNMHLAWLDFFDAHPEFDAYWMIEYDVLYSGPWNEVFDAFRDQPFDLLCAHLRRFHDEPAWYWWPEVNSPDEPLQWDRLVRGFLPVARLSRRGFERLRDAVARGWTGFVEGLVPTLFDMSGLRIGDIGGDGPFVPAGFTHRFYTSPSDREGSLVNLGTMRFRPGIDVPRIVPGRLYHPVKHGPQVVDAGVNQPPLACAAIRHVLRLVGEPQSPPPATSSLRASHLDRLLQAATGHCSMDLLGTLDRMASAGVKDLPVEALRQELVALRTAVAFRPSTT